MFEHYNFKIYYSVNDCGRVAEHDNEDFSLVQNFENGHLQITIEPKVKMQLVHIELKSDYMYGEKTSVLPNGYQSWTLTSELNRHDLQKGIRFPVSAIKFGRDIASINGDYNWKNYPEKRGVFHGYTFGYIRDNDNYKFIGSLNERTGYTIINFDMDNNTLTLEKEVEGKSIDSAYSLFDIVFIEGKYDNVFDEYFKLLGTPPCRAKRTYGYTSWYNYFTNINEEIILRDLDGLSRANNINVFQIDDGYQSAVGDWEITDKEKFPNGMKYIADKIHEKGYLAGLWLAPFYVQKNSKVANEHPEWLLKDENGKFAKGYLGNRPCYTLNFYIKECANYIRKFFNTILNDWGYDLVKLDFLYTACLIPFANRTRGEIMFDAMDFLRDCVGDKLILGCGVPLAPAFGKVDFCRIGSDVDIQFKPRFIYSLTNNEIISTQTSIKNAIFRRGLNGRAFLNDPDVFFMRETNLKYTDSEKRLVAEINKTFGNLLFISDNVGDFSDKQLSFLNEIYDDNNKIIDYVDYLGNNTADIYYTENNEKHKWRVNWLTGENTYQ